MSPAMSLDTVTITPSFPYALNRTLWFWLNSPRGPNFDDYGPKNEYDFLNEFVQRIAYEWTWVVMCGGEVCGFIGFRAVSPVSGMMRGVVIAPEYRGRGIAKVALKQALAVIQQKGVVKIQAMVYADNHPVKGLLSSVGAVEEGYCKNITKRDGKFIDGILWSVAGHDVHGDG